MNDLGWKGKGCGNDSSSCSVEKSVWYSILIVVYIAV